MQTIVLAGGCFWCLEASYQLVEGVVSVTNGYAGGKSLSPSYDTVSTGRSDHAEVVEVTFESLKISLDNILAVFWLIHDPTSLDRQGADIGPQYRSAIYYIDSTQKPTILDSLSKAQLSLDAPIVTVVEELITFYPAEEYHQNYFAKHPEQGYCQVVINPKLEKLRRTFSSMLR